MYRLSRTDDPEILGEATVFLEMESPLDTSKLKLMTVTAENTVEIPSWPVHVYINSFWAKNRKHILVYSRRRAGLCTLKLLPSLLGQKFCLHEVGMHHIGKVWRLLQLLYYAGVALKLNNCILFAKTRVYFGHFLRPGTHKVSHITPEATEILKQLTTQTQLHIFQGLYNVLKSFYSISTVWPLYLTEYQKTTSQGRWTNWM